MSERDDNTARVPNERLGRARRAMSSPSGSGREMSPQELAEAVNAYVWEHHGRQANLDRTYINKLESGKHHWPNTQYREAFRSVLNAPTDAALGFFCGRTPPTKEGAPVPGPLQPSQIPEAVRSGIALGETVNADVPDARLPNLRKLIAEVNSAYQRAEYEHALTLVPALMNATSVRVPTADDPRETTSSIALAHLALSKLMLKLGDPHLAWITADRARQHALESENPDLATATLFSLGCALNEFPDRKDAAQDVVERGLNNAGSTSNQPAHPRQISVLGALTLLAAVLAARRHEVRLAEQHLLAAGALANRLDGDHNELWTAFGPTNVLIHRVGITAATDPHRAIDLGERLDTGGMPSSLVSRRTQVHLDLASAFSQRPGGDASALLHLLQAEQHAPQLLRYHPPARTLIKNLLGRERRTATPGLRALATRAQVEA